LVKSEAMQRLQAAKISRPPTQIEREMEVISGLSLKQWGHPYREC
jgi:hypothetical protein